VDESSGRHQWHARGKRKSLDMAHASLPIGQRDDRPAPAGGAAHAARHRSLRTIYREHFNGGRRERMFLASVGFFLAFVLVRVITHLIHLGVGPFRDIEPGGFHLHHLVWGILLLLLVGYLWLAQVGSGAAGASVWASRLTATLFGVGAALTLDELALWLTLEDVYWAKQGRLSIDAVVLFGALLSVGSWGRPFFRALGREMGSWFPRST
jgi:hypothetical protein